MNLLFYVGLVVTYLSWSALNHALLDTSLAWLVKLSPSLVTYAVYIYLSEYHSLYQFKAAMCAVGIGTCYSVWLVVNLFLVTAVLSGQTLAILSYAALVALFLGIYECIKQKFHSKQP